MALTRLRNRYRFAGQRPRACYKTATPFTCRRLHVPMLTAFGALAPIFAVIGLGALIRVRGFDPPGFWAGAESVVYRLLFPLSDQRE